MKTQVAPEVAPAPEAHPKMPNRPQKKSLYVFDSKLILLVPGGGIEPP